MNNPCNDLDVVAALPKFDWEGYWEALEASRGADGEREAYEAMWDAREASRGPNENFEGPCSCCPKK